MAKAKIQRIQPQPRWHNATSNPTQSDWYATNYCTLHPGIMFGKPGSFERYWDNEAGIWRVAGPGTPQSAFGEHGSHAWRE